VITTLEDLQRVARLVFGETVELDITGSEVVVALPAKPGEGAERLPIVIDVHPTDPRVSGLSDQAAIDATLAALRELHRIKLGMPSDSAVLGEVIRAVAAEAGYPGPAGDVEQLGQCLHELRRDAEKWRAVRSIRPALASGLVARAEIEKENDQLRARIAELEQRADMNAANPMYVVANGAVPGELGLLPGRLEELPAAGGLTSEERGLLESARECEMLGDLKWHELQGLIAMVDRLKGRGDV
jgi:hypothetical protein